MFNLFFKKGVKCKGIFTGKGLFIIFIYVGVNLLLAINANATDPLINTTSSSRYLRDVNNQPLLNSYDTNYIEKNCNGATFAQVVTINIDTDLGAVIDSFLDKDSKLYSPDYWVKFDEVSTVANRSVIPWTPKNGEKKGLLIYLGSGTYKIQQILDYFVSYKKSDLTGPRIGLCGFNDKNSQYGARLLLNSDNNNEPLRPSFFISMAQLELYNLNINADYVNPDVAAIGLANGGKLLMDGVIFSRNGNDIQDSEVGLVDNYKSYVSIKASQLKQDTNTGTVIQTAQGVVNCGEESLISVTQGVNVFKGFSNEINLRSCHFNSQANKALKSNPVFFYDNFDEVNVADCTVEQYKFCKEFPEERANDSDTCAKYVAMCDTKANVFDIRDNTFTGHWKYIFRSRWSSFPLQDSNKFATDSNGVKAGSFEECADKGSFSIYGNFLFDSERCVNRIIW
ncbi:MAG: hypothetical protein HAW66_07580 [Shewanella sp.]|nr:hypothetical protein [Shewanella sp.]